MLPFDSWRSRFLLGDEGKWKESVRMIDFFDFKSPTFHQPGKSRTHNFCFFVLMQIPAGRR